MAIAIPMSALDSGTLVRVVAPVVGSMEVVNLGPPANVSAIVCNSPALLTAGCCERSGAGAFDTVCGCVEVCGWGCVDCTGAVGAPGVVVCVGCAAGVGEGVEAVFGMAGSFVTALWASLVGSIIFFPIKTERYTSAIGRCPDRSGYFGRWGRWNEPRRMSKDRGSGRAGDAPLAF